MLSLPLGPLSLPVGPLLLAAAGWVAMLLASRLAARVASRVASGPAGRGAADEAATGLARRASDLVLHAWLAGLVAARLGHLAVNAQAYAAAPLSAFDIRDGGWQPWVGIAGGAAWLAWRLWPQAALRQPVVFATGAGLALWWAAQVLIEDLQPQRPPSVALRALDDGRSADLAQLVQGRPTVVNLWASWCGPCREEMPVLAAAQRQEPQLRFVFVNQGESPERVREYLRTHGLQIGEVWLDPAAATGPAVGSRGLPTTLFYDAQGRRVGAHLGVLNAAALQGRLRALRPAP